MPETITDITPSTINLAVTFEELLGLQWYHEKMINAYGAALDSTKVLTGKTIGDHKKIRRIRIRELQSIVDETWPK